MFTIIFDGIAVDFVKKIKRISNIRSSDISGWMMDGSYNNDVMGQYLDFEVELAPFWWMPGDRYASIYEAITAPVDGHTIIMPYNEGSIEVCARVEQISDECIRRQGGRMYWKEPSFVIRSNAPTKFLELGEVLTRGRQPLPDLVDGVDGDAWVFKEDSGGWQHGNYPDYSDSYW